MMTRRIPRRRARLSYLVAPWGRDETNPPQTVATPMLTSTGGIYKKMYCQLCILLVLFMCGLHLCLYSGCYLSSCGRRVGDTGWKLLKWSMVQRFEVKIQLKRILWVLQITFHVSITRNSKHL